MQQCIKVLLFLLLNEVLHVSGETPPIIISLKLHFNTLLHLVGFLSVIIFGYNFQFSHRH